MAFFSKLCPEFRAREDDGIDLPAELHLRRLKASDDIQRRWLANSEQIDVAVTFFASDGDRAKDESDRNTVGKRMQCFTEDHCRPNRLYDQALQLRIYGTRGIGLKIDLMAADGSEENPRVREELQLSLNGPQAITHCPDYLAQIERFVGMTEK